MTKPSKVRVLPHTLGITDDSRKVKKGYLFVAVKGMHSDGHDYISEDVKNGAKEVYGICTHAVLSGPALERISKSKIKKLVTTDSIRPEDMARKCSKIEFLSVASLLGEAIRRIYHADSVSSLFV